MKYLGFDTAVAGGRYVKVSYYYDSSRGINITRISIIGFTGDPTNYTSVIRVCNYYGSTPITADLVWRGPVTTTSHERYIKPSSWGAPLVLTSSALASSAPRRTTQQTPTP